jgi:hypothetical protein
MGSLLKWASRREMLSAMRLLELIVAASLGLALAGWPPRAAAEHERDFVLVDEEGHLILRFSGAQAGTLTESQRREMANISLSVMVQDRIWADVEFYSEPVDTAWAGAMQARIQRHVTEAIPAMRVTRAECRSASCRLVLEHAGGHDVAEHQALMGIVEHAVRAFVDAHPETFAPVFLIAGAYQEPENPYIKVFLHGAARRSDGSPQTGGRARAPGDQPGKRRRRRECLGRAVCL